LPRRDAAAMPSGVTAAGGARKITPHSGQTDPLKYEVLEAYWTVAARDE
jgi:hypothetical protein